MKHPETKEASAFFFLFSKTNIIIVISEWYNKTNNTQNLAISTPNILHPDFIIFQPSIIFMFFLFWPWP